MLALTRIKTTMDFLRDMMPIKTIVVALAFDHDSKRVASRAVQLASQHNATLIGVHVIESSVPDDSDMPAPINTAGLATMVEEQSGRQLESLLASHKGSTILHVESGKAHKVIENLATEHSANLIVIGPGAAKGLREKIFGSTADHVIRYTSCPVLVVRQNASAPYSNIAVGIDFSEHAKAAALWASRLSPAATRELIHAFEIPLQFEQAMLKAGTSQAEIDHYRRAKAESAQKKITESYGDKGRLPKATRISIIRGAASETLLKVSHRSTTDLVALGVQGANALAQHLLGSVARRVLNGAKCDVLVVPAMTQ